ncbi:MAG: PepSY domain-containing protein [Sulfuricaulis sp.]
MKTTTHIRTITLAVAVLGLGMTMAAHAVSPREAAALNKTDVSLTQATQLAEKQEPGKTISVEFDIEKGVPLWEVKVLGKEGVKEYKIDAASGVVLKVEDERTRGELAKLVTGMNLKDLDNAKTSLGQAISTAEKKLNGKAVKVQVEHEHGSIQYDIFVRAGNKTTKLKIDANTELPR